MGAAASSAALFRRPTALRAADATITIGVSGPQTGPNAQHGAQWVAAFDLAIEQIAAQGGPHLRYVFEDSQSEPRQSVSIAQKFVNDPDIAIEVGDFSSTASMAASPIYQRGKLVQFGMTNSHPDFTKGGDYMWSSSISQAEEQPNLADFAVNGLGLKKLAVLHLNTDWGNTSKTLFVQAAQALGAEIVAVEGFLPAERDFRSTLVRIRDTNPTGLILEAYYADAAVIARQVHDLGLKQPIAAVSSVYSPKFIELGGDAVNGIYTQSNFFPDDPRPEVQAFVRAFQTRYGRQPDGFNATAYDTFILIGELVRQFGGTREAIRDGLTKIKNVPSVVYGKISFDPDTRRVAGARYERLLVKDSQFTLWDGSRPAI
ncbi:MAG: ABC transporter substrate-binding protein [Azospirillaceae bacterium]|nr:ABC transporter substrate-binding protein [Azospirillaceae bacterium]